MSGVDLYYYPGAYICRSVQSVAIELGITLSLKPVKLSQMQQLEPWFVAINPQHTIPTLVDHDNDDFVLWESRAIMTYLINKTDPNHKLYPGKDLKIRATIDRWLYFDLAVLEPAWFSMIHNYIMLGTPITEDMTQKLKKALTSLNDTLSKSEYLATNGHYTVADLAVLSNLTVLEVIDFDLKPWSHLSKWYNRLKQSLVYYNELHQSGIDGMKRFAEEPKTGVSQEWFKARD